MVYRTGAEIRSAIRRASLGAEADRRIRDGHAARSRVIESRRAMLEKSISFKKAAADGVSPLVINLDMMLHHGAQPRPMDAAALKTVSRSVNIFKHEQQSWGQRMVRSAEEYRAAIEEATQIDPRAWQRTFVVSNYDAVPYEQFQLGDDQKSIAAYYRALMARFREERRQTMQRHIFGPPVMITAMPTERHRKRKLTPKFLDVNSYGGFLESHAQTGNALLLLDVMDFEDSKPGVALRDDFMQHDKHDVIARPVLTVDSIDSEDRHRDQGTQEFAWLHFQIASADQYVLTADSDVIARPASQKKRASVASLKAVKQDPPPREPFPETLFG